MKTRFEIHYRTSWGESLAVEIGGKTIPMQWNEGGLWTAEAVCRKDDFKEYGYVVLRDGLVERTEWTAHSCAPAEVLHDSWLDCPVPGCPFVRKHQAEIFDRPGFRGAGTAVPVFSLRTERDYGIGDFRDLRPLVDWAASTGQTVIQLLPVGDTTRQGGWEDSYPYSPVSSFALHPLYLRLQDIGIKEDEAFLKAQEDINALPEIDWPRVAREKMALIRKAFAWNGKKDCSTREYKLFNRENAYWLDEYAAFCAERDGDTESFHRWMQFHLDRQLSEEAAYARSKGVHFKGDLPIGVSRDSVEARFHPELFHLDQCAGAPPDFFSKDGQNWGFPTYNWDAMALDGYAWWRKRLRRMSRWFDAYRIDHILGFFRIWEIPAGQASGKAGHFNPALPYKPEELRGLPMEGLFHEDPHNPGMFQPLISPDTSALDDGQKRRFDALWEDFFFRRHNGFWKRNALKKIPALLSASGMLACGEDLGMIPDCVPEVMDSWRILSLEMPMMDKGRPWPRLSVCTSSSHDMETFRQQFFAREGRDPECWEVQRALSGILSSDSMLAILPLQDWLAISAGLRRADFSAERINEPADPHHHWRYRLHLPLERLGEDSAFCTAVTSIIKDTNRFNY